MGKKIKKLKEVNRMSGLKVERVLFKNRKKGGTA